MIFNFVYIVEAGPRGKKTAPVYNPPNRPNTNTH